LRKNSLAAVIPIAVALLTAACGSSTTKSSSTGSAVATASTSSQTSTRPSAQASSTSAGAATRPALITTKHDPKLGTILAYGPKRLTVYLFEADKGASSSCSGACAKVWPPITGTLQATGGAMSADLGTIKRPDGTAQVTYKGHPLYLYVKDKDDGDAYGQGINSFGAGWYALAPSGKKLDLS
jgi:predicted lipoprotein with Yx(FWY)xxD motif